jgi:hypothetical protein
MVHPIPTSAQSVHNAPLEVARYVCGTYSAVDRTTSCSSSLGSSVA